MIAKFARNSGTWHNGRRFLVHLWKSCGTQGPQIPKEKLMKKDIHPEYVLTEVTCTCGNHFTTRSTIQSGQMRVDVCSACHPFYTGKQKILDTGGRVARFEARYAKFNEAKKKAAAK